MQYALIFASAAALVAALPQQVPAPSQKLPWVQPGKSASAQCGKPNFNEAICGTEAYCRAIDESGAAKVIGNRWKTTYDCFRAHEADPKLLPFDKTSPWPDCGWGGFGEAWCGTMEYCRAIDQEGPRSNRLLFNRWESTAECLAAHEKLPWVEAESLDCGWRGYTETLCGTEDYCKSFDDKDLFNSPFGNDGKFESAAECFAAHATKPAEKKADDKKKQNVPKEELRWPFNTPEWSEVDRKGAVADPGPIGIRPAFD